MAGFMKYPEGWENLLAPLQVSEFLQERKGFFTSLKPQFLP